MAVRAELAAVFFAGGDEEGMEGIAGLGVACRRVSEVIMGAKSWMEMEGLTCQTMTRSPDAISLAVDHIFGQVQFGMVSAAYML